MLAQNNELFEETCETVYKLNQNEEVRYLCEMREEGERIMRTYKSLIKQRDAKLAEKDEALAKSAVQLAKKDEVLAEKDEELAKNAVQLAEKDAIIASLQAQLKAQQKQENNTSKI